MTDGELSPAHAAVLARGTHDLPHHLMVAVDGLLEPEAGQTLLAALEPLARPATAEDDRSGGQRRADVLAELARRALEGGWLPQAGGVRPQLTVLVDLDSLQSRSPGGLGGDSELGPLTAEGCRRLACDGAVTRVLVTRQPTNHHAHGPTGPDAPLDHLSGHHGHQDLSGHHHHDHDPGGLDPGGHEPGGLDPGGHRGHHHPGGDGTLAAQLQTAARRLPPILGGAPDPTLGGRPHHPGHPTRPTPRPRGPRRRLRRARL